MASKQILFPLARSIHTTPAVLFRCSPGAFGRSLRNVDRHHNQPVSHDHFDDFFSTLRNSFEDEWFSNRSHPGRSFSRWTPSVDIKQSGDNIVLTAELAGMTPNDINVDIKDDTLVISGEKKHVKTSENDNYTLTERSYGKFSRSFPLSNNIDKENIQAKFEHGVLQVTLNKLKEKEPTKVKINWSAGEPSQTGSQASQESTGHNDSQKQ